MSMPQQQYPSSSLQTPFQWLTPLRFQKIQLDEQSIQLVDIPLPNSTQSSSQELRGTPQSIVSQPQPIPETQEDLNIPWKVKMRAQRQFYKDILLENPKLSGLKHLFQWVNREQGESKLKFMKFWIILQKYDLLRQTLKYYISLIEKYSTQQHLQNKSTQIRKDVLDNIRECLEQSDLESAFKHYWGKSCSGKSFKSKLAELRQFRKQIRRNHCNTEYYQ